MRRSNEKHDCYLPEKIGPKHDSSVKYLESNLIAYLTFIEIFQLLIFIFEVQNEELRISFKGFFWLRKSVLWG